MRLSQPKLRQRLKELVRKSKGITAHNVPTWGNIQPTCSPDKANPDKSNPFTRNSVTSKEREN